MRSARWLAPCLALLLAAPARAEWTRLGSGDCAAADVSVSKGLNPARGRCDASMGGMTAVCWDNATQHDPALKGPGCAYKKVRAESCQGGAHPGTVYRCDGFPLASSATSARPKGAAGAKTATGAKAEPPKKEPAPKPAPEDAAEPPPASSAHIKVQGYLNLAAELFAARDYEGALAELKRAQQSEDLAIVRFNLARCLEELERGDEAVKAFREYLVVPDHAAGAEVRQGYARQTIALLTGANDLPAEAPPEAALGWKYLRVDGCDGAEAGNSDGTFPATQLCVPATEGNAAVCYDGAQYANPAFNGPACVYKSVLASSCRGGSAPGLLYECTPKGGAAAASPAAQPTGGPARYSWSYVGAGDCKGGDAGSSQGGDPVDARCDASQAGKLAICWDGVTQRNPALKGAGCTYKSFAAKKCQAGANPGYVFECLAEGTASSELPSATTPSQAAAAAAKAEKKPAAPATPGTWVKAGTGDCVGNELGASQGLNPARARCDSAHAGQVAVCWDGKSARNPALRGPGCAYKSTKAESCRGGPHPGVLYRCGK